MTVNEHVVVSTLLFAFDLGGTLEIKPVLHPGRRTAERENESGFWFCPSPRAIRVGSPEM